MGKKEKEKKDRNTISFEIDPENVKDEYTRIPAHIATINSVYAQSVGTSIRAKYRRDRVFAEIHAEIVNMAEDNGGKKPSEASIKQQVLTHPEYEKAVMTYAAAEEAKAFAAGQCEAITAKKDMIVSLGAHVRQELGGMGGGVDDEDDQDDDDDED